MAAVIREPSVAGSFYPGNAGRLEADIDSYLEKVTLDRSGEDIVALVAPHAGYMCSGPVAAWAYRQVQGKSYDTVVVISPSHRAYFSFSSVFCGKGYRTPLGLVPVDIEAAKALAGCGADNVHSSPEGHLHTSEHALEIQLPFLQVVLGSFKLVPVVMGNQGWENCLSLGGALAD
ncbi:MAG: AmmeMemoRadiSam system protein B, partial [Gemmatimonadota bacterium]|nr:AmmeMemoRadiSam system protein B [Gemmatimonadota bacterium]